MVFHILSLEPPADDPPNRPEGLKGDSDGRTRFTDGDTGSARVGWLAPESEAAASST